MTEEHRCRRDGKGVWEKMYNIMFKKRRYFPLHLKKNTIILTGLVAYSYFVFRGTARNWPITWELQQ